MGVKNEPLPTERGGISMKKRIFLLAALAAGLVLCLAACGETNGDPVTVSNSGVIHESVLAAA